MRFCKNACVELTRDYYIIIICYGVVLRIVYSKQYGTKVFNFEANVWVSFVWRWMWRYGL